jgi:beta-N-acetylhexosaminidase
VGTNSKATDLMHKFEVSKIELEKRGFTVEMRVNCPYYGSDLNALNKNDKIILAFDHHPHDPMGTVQLYEDEILTVWLAKMLPNEKVISVSFGDPYVHNVYLPLIHTCINAYSSSSVSQIALIKAITGEIPIKGISPVNLLIPGVPVRK